MLARIIALCEKPDCTATRSQGICRVSIMIALSCHVIEVYEIAALLLSPQLDADVLLHDTSLILANLPSVFVTFTKADLEQHGNERYHTLCRRAQ
jgi:hypothetical protein